MEKIHFKNAIVAYLLESQSMKIVEFFEQDASKVHRIMLNIKPVKKDMMY